MKSKTVKVEVLVTIGEDEGKSLPLTKNGVDALAHAMVHDAILFTENNRGFYRGPVKSETLGVSWSIPKAECGLAELDDQIDKGGRSIETGKAGEKATRAAARRRQR